MLDSRPADAAERPRETAGSGRTARTTRAPVESKAPVPPPADFDDDIPF
jgi:hypothetical protein